MPGEEAPPSSRNRGTTRFATQSAAAPSATTTTTNDTTSDTCPAPEETLSHASPAHQPSVHSSVFHTAEPRSV